MNIIIFIIILFILVVSHEWGHFIVAKKSGIRVDEFAFGMGPKVWSFKRGETIYKINLLPIGGYVKIFGENPDEDSMNGPDSSRSFVNKPRYIQAAVLFAGVAMNFLLAWLLISIGFMAGLPSSVDSLPARAKVKDAEVVIVDVLPHSPADTAGLKVGDRITYMQSGIDGTKIPSKESVQYFIRNHGADKITVSFRRDAEESKVTLTPKAGLVDNMPGVGISMDVVGTAQLPLTNAVSEGLKLTLRLTKSTVIGFYELITGHTNIKSLTGPIGLVHVVGDAAKFGFMYLLSFTALISVNLAVINLIPFPALDGGRLLFLLIEKIKGSRITPKIANMVNLIGFGLLMLLMAVITFHDIVKLF